MYVSRKFFREEIKKYIVSNNIIMKKITSQQQRVLDCIQIYLNKTGFPPTRADIYAEN